MTTSLKTLSETDIVQRLNAIDWNFPQARTFRQSVHALHWFPGNFIPQIPAHFIQILSRPGDLVLDPFCGSGTTGAEAYKLQRHSLQSDVCRASIQVAEGKIALLKHPQLATTLERMRNQLHFESLARCDGPVDTKLEEWLDADTLSQLRYLWGLVADGQQEATRSILELLFSDVLFACASTGGSATKSGGRRRHHWGWIADNVKPKEPRWHNAVRAFRDRLSLAAAIMQAEAGPSSCDAVVKRESVADMSCPLDAADLVVTSPPYLGMTDYALANRLTYLWMGWDLDTDRSLELGSRRSRNRVDALNRYLEGIDKAADRICCAMRPQAYCAIVIGASRKYEHAALEAVDVFGKRLKPVWGPVERVVSRRRVAERLGRRAKEWLCVLRRSE